MIDDKMDNSVDAALSAWARHDKVDADAVERIMLHAGQISQQKGQGLRHWLPWAAAGGAIAASVAAAIIFAVPGTDATGAFGPEVVAAVPDGDFAGQASFALLYTPTADEELLI